jgi:hypothetical protein
LSGCVTRTSRSSIESSSVVSSSLTKTGYTHLHKLDENRGPSG